MTNREVKFRGKRLDNKEWVYGYYVKKPSGKHFIYYQPFAESTQNTYHEVDPSTVGQYSGERDKNYVEIWEGSRVRCYYGGDPQEQDDTIVFKNGAFWLERRNTSLHQWLSEDGGPYTYEIEVTGSIHDDK